MPSNWLNVASFWLSRVSKRYVVDPCGCCCARAGLAMAPAPSTGVAATSATRAHFAARLRRPAFETPVDERACFFAYLCMSTPYLRRDRGHTARRKSSLTIFSRPPRGADISIRRGSPRAHSIGIHERSLTALGGVRRRLCPRYGRPLGTRSGWNKRPPGGVYLSVAYALSGPATRRRPRPMIGSQAMPTNPTPE